MSYCTLDEAFGSPYLSEQENNYDKCVKKSKVRKRKINCNEKKSRFNSNLIDVKLNSYNPKKNPSELLNSSNNAYGYFPSHMEKFENFSNMNNQENNSNSNSNITTLVSNNRNTRNNRNNRNNRNRNNRREPNEIFEYNEEDNLPMNNSQDYEVVNSSEGESTDAVEIDEENNEDYYNKVNNGESVNNLQNSNNSEIEIVNNDNNNLISSQISEINNKISFIMNQMNKDESNNDTSENNVHDIILFIIFGIFVLLILESLYKMISRVLKAKHGMSINLS